MFLENILSEYNKPLRFRLLAFFILSLPTFQSSIQLQNILFSLVTPNYTCQYNSTSKFTVSKDQCSVAINGSTIKCTQWNFSLFPIGKTMVSDYGLVCDYKYLGDIALIAWYVSFLIGPIVGFFSDEYGRKKVALCCLSLETVSSISVAFVPDISSNIFLRICVGLSASGVFISYVWLLEITNKEYRACIGSFYWFYWCIAYVLFPLIAYLTRDWKYSQLFSMIPSTFYIAILFMPESPRWSSVMDRKQEMMNTLRKIASVNQINFNLISEDIYVEKKKKDHNIIDAFKNPDFVLRMIVGFICMTSINVLYSAMVVSLTILSNNIFISVFFLGLMEFPGMFLSFFTLRFLKRKLAFFTIGGIGGVLIFLSSFFNRDKFTQSIIRIILGCIAKVAVGSCYQTAMVYVSELFPTTHRSFGLNLLLVSNVVSFTGAVFINKLSSIYEFIPILIYLIILIVADVMVFFILPETKDLPIPETIFDMKMLKCGTENSFLYYMNNKFDFVDDISSATINDFDVPDEETYLINGKN